MSEGKRRINQPEDSGTIENVIYNAASGGQKNLNVLPVPKATIPAGDQKIGKGILVLLGTAGYTLKDSNAVLPNLVVSATLAPIGSVVSTGLEYDTITLGAGCFLVADDSSAI